LGDGTVADNLLIKFEGQLADTHRLPAYEASQSFYGISRALLIAMNYLDEGRVRRREFIARGFKINIVAQRPGSFETLYEIITNPEVMAIAKQLGVGVTGGLLLDYLKTIFRRSVGEKGEPSIEELEAEGKLNPGDLSALEDAIEPAMKAAHTVINHGAGQIIIVNGDNNVVTLNSRTKEYVLTSTLDETSKTKLFSIASYNANQRSGRAFDFEFGKTVPFEIAKNADRETLSIVLSSISSYAMRRLGDDIRSAIAINYYSVVSIEGKLKKIVIIKARKELTELGR
jgi:predicted regulator of Ras-like GTPase activity (Roadblock/LC7/MglB family)